MPTLPERLRAAGPGRIRLLDGLALLLLAGGLAALYGPYLDAPLVFDDIDFFASNYVSRYGSEFSPLMLRYWTYASFAFQHIVFGNDPGGFRLVNVVLHLLVGAALYLFMRTLLGLTLPGRPASQPASDAEFGSRLAIWLGVALFLFHPIAVYGVAYLVGRSIVMTTLFSLLMWWAHLRGLDSGKPEWFALALLFYCLALYSKEHSVMAPAVAGMLTLLVVRVEARRGLLVLVFLSYLALAVTVLLAHRETIGSTYEPLVGTIPHAYLASVLTQAGLFFKYLFLWWIPLTSQMAIDMREPLAGIDSATAWLWLAGFLLYLAVGFLLLLRKGRGGLLGFALLAPALLFMTEFSAVRIQESFVLYRSYLWLPPMLLTWPLLSGLEPTRKWWLPAGIVLCLLLCIPAANRLKTFASAFTLWNEAIALAERRGDTWFRDRQYVNRGGTYLLAGRMDLALQDFERALQWNPTQAVALLGKGRALARLGNTRQALLSYDQALAAKPGWVDVYLARAELNSKTGKPEAAMEDYELACEKDVLVACYVLEKIRLGTNDEVTITVRQH
jgi:tetratricopeptide (TPR) repeat protein